MENAMEVLHLLGAIFTASHNAPVLPQHAKVKVLDEGEDDEGRLARRWWQLPGRGCVLLIMGHVALLRTNGHVSQPLRRPSRACQDVVKLNKRSFQIMDSNYSAGALEIAEEDHVHAAGSVRTASVRPAAVVDDRQELCDGAPAVHIHHTHLVGSSCWGREHNF